MTEPTENRGSKKTWLCRENILLGLGVLIIVVELVNSELIGHRFHYEFLLAGLTLCGVGITQIGDRK